MDGVGIADKGAYALDGLVRLFKQARALVDPFFLNIVAHSHTVALFKHLGKIFGRIERFFRQQRKRELFRVMRPDKIRYIREKVFAFAGAREHPPENVSQYN